MRYALVVSLFITVSPAFSQEQHKFSVPFNIDDYEYVLPGLCRDVKLTVAGLTTWGTFCDTAIPQVAAQRAMREFSLPKPEKPSQDDQK